MMVIPALVILLILLTVIFRKVRVCFNAETTSDTVMRPPNDEINVENIRREEPKPSTPSLSSPKTMVGSEFDVFLSFRGEDTRNGFTDHLYEGLQLRSVNTFIDSEGLKKGEEIKKLLGYIEKSKICIPIFSKGYADSKWCLRELAKVVECKKKVIPVFFDVDPSHVKDQTHSFASGFKKHESEGEVKQEELIKWRDALREVGNISGFTLKDTNWKEGKLVQIIVKRILQELNPHHLHVGKYIVGHESLLEELESTLDMKSNDVKMIGIHGMGGIGKTTLVKALYNKISSEFEAYSFLLNIRGTSLVSLQQQLLKDIFQSDETVINESNGIHRIKQKECKKKVLIILDDVDSRHQLDALVGGRDWFGEGSRIIITTRDTKPLINHGVKGDEIYELQGLNYDYSKKLFCHHAFGNEKPSLSNKYAKMCDEALSFINGLPLALEVLGSQFSDLKTEKEWRGWLARLKDCQDEEIFEKLKLSYDSLQDSEKKVFLDIACFFVGTRTMRIFGHWGDIPFEVDDVKLFWEECGFYPEPTINVLKHKSLIKIQKIYESKGDISGTHFEMHDQIRDMGRKIVEDEEKEGKSCSRLWNIPKVIQTLQKQRVPTTATIEGIMFQGEEGASIEGIMFQGEEGASDVIVTHLKEIDQLRLFHVQGAKIEGSLHFPKNLKWLGLPNCQHLTGAKMEGSLHFLKILKWSGLPNCQHLTSPSVSIPAEVRVLDLHRNDNVAKVLVEKCRSTSTVFKKLKILDLTRTRITITPDFSCIPSLLKLTLKYCTKLVEVHESVGKLKSLVWLNLTGCEKLEKLPHSISKLTSLEFFCLYGCSDLLYLPKQLGNMTSLKHLDLRTDSEHIKSLSSSIEKLDRLEHLHVDYHIGAGEGDLVAKSELFLRYAYLLDALPDPCCRRKTHLCLHDITIEELMDSFIRWESLESLILNCTSLKSLPASVGQLQKLKVLEVYSNKLLLADDALPLKSIERLELKCDVFKHLPPFSKKAQNLKILALTCTKMEVLPDWIGSSSKLEILELSQCFNTSRFPFVMLKKLKTLELSAKQITVTPDFSFAPHLEELTLIDCEMLTEVHESVGTLVNLKSLKITGCNALEGLPEAICHLTSLKSLELRQYVGCCSVGEEIIRLETRIKSILSSLEQLTNLEKICIYKDLGGTNVKRIEFEMSTLEISGLSLECVTSLWSSVYVIHSVKTLVIINDQIEELPDSIAQMQNLEHLIFECGSLKAVPNWIGQLRRLYTFQPRSEYGGFQTQPDCIQSLGGLQELSLRGCKNIKHLPDIVGQMENLRFLDLSGSGIIELPPWLGCLTHLNLGTTHQNDVKTESLKLPSWVGWLTNSTHLNLSTTHQNDVKTGIVKLPPWLGCLTNLTHLNLSTTHQNDYLFPDLSHLTSLEELDLSGRNFGSSLSCISNFPRLRVLNVSGCKQLRSIPHLSSSVLRMLDASNCTNLRGLPDFSNLQSLRYLSLTGCNSLECILGFKTIAENIETLELQGPSGVRSNFSDDFTDVFMGARFQNLRKFKMKGNIIAGSRSVQQCLSFLFPDVRFNKRKCSSPTLRLHRVSSPVDIKVITKDDLVLFKTTLPENEFDDGYKTFSFEKGDWEILEHLSKGSGTIQVSTKLMCQSCPELNWKQSLVGLFQTDEAEFDSPYRSRSPVDKH